MSYWDVSQMAGDIDLQSRCHACAEVEGIPDAGSWVLEHLWALASQPGWDAAWASAVAAGNESPGSDPGVITDGMILSGVQAVAGATP